MLSLTPSSFSRYPYASFHTRLLEIAGRPVSKRSLEPMDCPDCRGAFCKAVSFTTCNSPLHRPACDLLTRVCSLVPPSGSASSSSPCFSRPVFHPYTRQCCPSLTWAWKMLWPAGSSERSSWDTLRIPIALFAGVSINHIAQHEIQSGLELAFKRPTVIASSNLEVSVDISKATTTEPRDDITSKKWGPLVEEGSDAGDRV